MAGKSFNAEELNGLVSGVERARNTTVDYFAGASANSRTLPRVARPYYAPSLHVSESRRPGQERRPRAIGSWGSSATWSSGASSFDGVDGASTATMSTVPPSYSHSYAPGPPAASHRRPEVPDFRHVLLPCEFHEYKGCTAAFRLADVHLWINHILDQHLHHILPKVTACWFCDGALFAAASPNQSDKLATYRERMLHIAAHFRAGLTAGQVRPDYHMVQHLHQNGLLDAATFHRLTRRGELPPRFMVHEFGDHQPRASQHMYVEQGAYHTNSGRRTSHHRSSRRHDGYM